VARYIGVPISGTVLPNVYVTVAVALPMVDWLPAKFPPPPVIVNIVEVDTGISKLPAPVYRNHAVDPSWAAADLRRSIARKYSLKPSTDALRWAHTSDAGESFYFRDKKSRAK